MGHAGGSHIIVGETVRPWRDAFSKEFTRQLQQLLPHLAPRALELVPCSGVAVQGLRHELFVDPQTRVPAGEHVLVGLLDLPPQLRTKEEAVVPELEITATSSASLASKKK